jgi:hypothetical protein
MLVVYDTAASPAILSGFFFEHLDQTGFRSASYKSDFQWFNLFEAWHDTATSGRMLPTSAPCPAEQNLAD